MSSKKRVLTRWTSNGTSINRWLTSGSKSHTVGIWFSNEDDKGLSKDHYCYFEVLCTMSHDDFNTQGQKEFKKFTNLFDAILFADNWAVRNKYALSKPLEIPDIGSPYTARIKIGHNND